MVGLLGCPLAYADVCRYVDPSGDYHYSNLQPEIDWRLLSCENDQAPISQAALTNQADKKEVAFRAAFNQVKIGMSMAEVHRLGQVGNKCTDWPHQSPPTCGPLHYFSDVRTIQTKTGTTTIYSYGRDRLVYENGTLAVIGR